MMPHHPSFSGHQSFPFRYPWLKKGVDGITSDPRMFGADDAMVRLGVGKNMVASMRHWGLALGVLQESSDASGKRGRALEPTDLGNALFSDSGWDPFLEDPGTLWLLHWQLVNQPSKATTWWWVFNQYSGVEFTRQELLAKLEALARQQAWTRTSSASLKRDVEVFVRTYAAPQRAASVQEDSLDCPLVELGLVRPSNAPQTFRLARGAHATLPPEIFGYALADYLERRSEDSHTVTLEDLSYAAGAPGRVFCLSEIGLLRQLDKMDELSDGGIAFDETAGLKQVYVHRLPNPHSFLDRYYTTGRSRTRVKSTQ
jgi:hypothetical protein